MTSHPIPLLFVFIHLPSIYIIPMPRLLIDFKNRKMTHLLTHVIMHLSLFLLSDWLIFGHMIIPLM